MENKDNARAVFEQYWLQARHDENERLWLTNVLAIIFAALLGLITVQGLQWYIPAFGMLLSITGIFSNTQFKGLVYTQFTLGSENHDQRVRCS